MPVVLNLRNKKLLLLFGKKTRNGMIRHGSLRGIAMRRELKQILYVCAFWLIGGMLGYFVVTNQMNQMSDPEYIALWASQNMAVPEPLGYTRGILSFGLLFSGIPTGLMLYCGIVRKWLTPIAPKMIIGLITFPIYTLVGAIGSIPFVVYKGLSLLRNNLNRDNVNRGESHSERIG